MTCVRALAPEHCQRWSRIPRVLDIILECTATVTAFYADVKASGIKSPSSRIAVVQSKAFDLKIPECNQLAASYMELMGYTKKQMLNFTEFLVRPCRRTLAEALSQVYVIDSTVVYQPQGSAQGRSGMGSRPKASRARGHGSLAARAGVGVLHCPSSVSKTLLRVVVRCGGGPPPQTILKWLNLRITPMQAWQYFGASVIETK